jgi:ADP-heptose:LPS heptosyltransferase
VTQLATRLLIDLPNWLGDVIHALPAVAALRSANRGPTVLLARDRYVPLLRSLGHAAETRPWGAGYYWSRANLTGRFDTVLTSRHSSRSKLLVAGSGAARRLASRGRGAAVLGLSTFNVDRARHQRHDLDGALALLSVESPPVASFVLALGPARDRDGRLRRALIGNAPRLVALAPASQAMPMKRYPEAWYAALARALVKGDVNVAVVVGPGEEAIGRRIAVPGGAALVPTAWPLEEVAALLAACDAAVGNDSGLTHLAALVGCPTVALFGPTDPARTAPVGDAVVLSRAGRWGGDWPPPSQVASVVAALARRADRSEPTPGALALPRS